MPVRLARTIALLAVGFATLASTAPVVLLAQPKVENNGFYQEHQKGFLIYKATGRTRRSLLSNDRAE